MSGTIRGADGLVRCQWGSTPEFVDYHDTEWGFPLRDDRRLFEMLCLESFQSGLSWRTILAKRENFRAAFRQFDFNAIARFTPRSVERLLQDAGIVRHRGKIEAVVHNARQVRTLIREEGSFAAFLWRHEARGLPSDGGISSESAALAAKLKKLGWAFVGPTTVYAFTQAAGLINPHVKGCVIRKSVNQARRRFHPPASKAT